MIRQLFILLLIFIVGCNNYSEKTKYNKEIMTLDSIAVLYHSGDFDNSIKLSESFTINYPNNDKGWHLLSSANLGKNKDSLAQIYANKALEINRNNFVALTNLGIILDKQEKYNEAIIFYERSLKINDSFPQTYSNYMLNRLKVKDYDCALVMGENALRFGNHIWDKANLCFIYHKVGNISKRDSLLKELKKLKFEKMLSLENEFL